MKKAAFVIAMLFVGFSLSAVSFGDYGCPAAWVPQSFMIGAGNDRWSGGMSFDYDDQLSFAEYFSLEAPAWKLAVNMLGITNRGWQEGWSVTDPSLKGDGNRISGRYDVTEILLGFPLELVGNPWFFVDMEPYFGVSVIGRQNYVVLQNTVHRILDMSQVHLEYETDSNKPYASLGGTIAVGGAVPLSWRTRLTLGVKGAFSNNIGFNHRQQADVFVSIKGWNRGLCCGDEGDILSFAVGYMWTQTKSDWRSAILYDEYMQGFTLGYNVNAGFLRLGYSSNLDTRRGYGTVVVDIMSLFEPSRWYESDIVLSLGKLSLMEVTFFDVGLELPLGYSNFSFVIRNRYVSGNPSYAENASSGRDPALLGRFQRNYDGAFLGAKYSFESYATHGFVTPYVCVSAGVMRWEAVNLVNMNETLVVSDSLVRNYYHSYSTGRLCSFAMDLEFGVSLLPQGLLTSSRTTFQIGFNAGVTFIHNPGEVARLLEAYTPDSPLVAMFMPHFGMSLRLGFDV